jgi:hypothetical protein
MSVISDLMAGGIEGLIGASSKVISQFVTNPEQKLEAQKLIFEAESQAKKQAFEADQAYMKDRASARELGKTDPWTPRILTILFVLGYFGVTIFMFLMMKGIVTDGTTMDNFTVAFISSIFGSFNTFVGMILAYYFGASKGGDDQGAKIADSFKSSMESKKK